MSTFDEKVEEARGEIAAAWDKVIQAMATQRAYMRIAEKLQIQIHHLQQELNAYLVESRNWGALAEQAENEAKKIE